MYLYLRSHHYIALAVLDLRDLPVCLTSAGIKDLCYHGEPRNGEFLIGEWVAENTQYILHFKICLHWGMVAHTIFALVRWRQRNLGLKGQPRATLGYLVSNTHLHMFFLMTKQTRDEQKDLTIRCWDWQVNHHVCKSISINNRFAVQLTLQTAKIHSAWNAISETDPPLHAWLTDYSASEATSISNTGLQGRVYTKNIPQLSYLHGLYTPCQMFTNLFHTQSRCVCKTTKHCDTRILPQHRPPPNPIHTAPVFLSEIYSLAAVPTPAWLLTNHLLLSTLDRHLVVFTRRISSGWNGVEKQTKQNKYTWKWNTQSTQHLTSRKGRLMQGIVWK